MRSRSLLDAKQKIFTYNHTSKSLFWNCFSKYTSQSLYLIALATGEFVGAFQKCLHIEALEKTKPYPHFQKLPSANKKKKPLSRRVNHALIAAAYLQSICCFMHHCIILNRQAIYQRNKTWINLIIIFNGFKIVNQQFA